MTSKSSMSRDHRGEKNPCFGVRKFGKDNGNFGKRWSLKKRKALSKKLKGKRAWNKGLSRNSDERVDKIASKLERVKQSIERRQNISKSRIKHNLKNGVLYGYAKRGTFYSKKNKKYIRYESSYELVAMKLFEEMDHLKSYRRCNFYIEYMCNNIIKGYIPDFLLIYECGVKEIIEVKPKKRLNEDINKLKFKAGKKYAKTNNLVFSIYTEKDLSL